MTYEDVIREALKYTDGEDTFESVLQKFEGNEYQGFHFDGLYLITTVIHYANGPRVRIAYAAGVLTETNVPQLLEVVERYAKAIGAVAVDLVGRKGWARQLQKYGYDAVYTVVRKKV